MLHRQNLRRLLGAGTIALVLGVAMAFYVADTADAGQTRCRQHRAEARERATIVTGEGAPVLVIGDSWSVGLGQDDLARSWPSRLDGQVHVAGFSGSGFSARASGCGTVSFADRAPTAVGVHPSLVVVEGGLNDYDQPAAAVESGFRDLMADLAGERVVVLGPASAPLRAAAMPRVEALLVRLSQEYGVPYVQTSDLALDYLDDELHLTAGGHAEFGDAVADRIAAVGPARPAVLPR